MGASLISVPRAATLPVMAFLGIMFAAMGYALYWLGRKDLVSFSFMTEVQQALNTNQALINLQATLKGEEKENLT